MKNLSKVIAIVFVSFVCLQMNAQTYTVKAGYTLSGIFAKNNDETFSSDYEMISGYHVGFSLEKPINDYLSFEPGAVLTTKGMKKEQGSNYLKRMNLYYLDIPITLKASLDLGDVFTLYCAAGPYVGVGFVGYYKEDNDDNIDYHSVDWGSDDSNDFRRLDCGFTFRTGVEMYSFLLEGAYDLGLANISSNHDNGRYQRNSVIKISIGYSFGK